MSFWLGMFDDVDWVLVVGSLFDDGGVWSYTSTADGTAAHFTDAYAHTHTQPAEMGGEREQLSSG